ncbi:choline dehydrogenase, mitochondrial-like [Atheta coriaria]|uniref:choline dehydrogenase, mitochondrial-like n=1 Tax=Dalotia coriaria TaxID=877792 RepID=UPI0031F4570A
MLAIKGFKRDYDEWANLGNTRWSWDNIKPYYDKAFKQMQTSTYQSPMPTRAMVLAAAEAMGLPVNDHSVHLGYQDINLTINANQRFNTAKAYIVTANKRRNLCVMTNTAVERVLFRRRDGPKAIGVLLQNEQKLYASKEVIMSAGAVMSPQLLMLSGIGPKSVLQPLRIPQIKELPGVGQNLQDHLMFPGYLVKIPHLPIAVDAKQFLEGYCQTKDGPIGQIDIGEMVGWINTRNDSEYPDIQYMHMTMLKKDQILSRSMSQNWVSMKYQQIVLWPKVPRI